MVNFFASLATSLIITVAWAFVLWLYNFPLQGWVMDDYDFRILLEGGSILFVVLFFAIWVPLAFF